jgi:dTDP-4-dehydrorhamnose 3,5-epimerase
MKIYSGNFLIEQLLDQHLGDTSKEGGMIFTETRLKGAYIVELEQRVDERGFFARFYCQDEYAKQGLDQNFVQINNSLSLKKGTLRGLHYQLAPKAETKVIRCLMGGLFDVILDLRIDSPTFGKYYGIELTEDNRRMLYVPKGFAHGFLTLADNTEALYLVSEFYAPDYERAIRWNDPQFQIDWPFEPLVISEKDKGNPLFDRQYHLNLR